MKHIVVCENQIRAEKYCDSNNLPLVDTIIIMFTGELSTFLMTVKNKKQVCTVHHLNDNYKFVINQFENLEWN